MSPPHRVHPSHQHIFRRAPAVIQPATNISSRKRWPLFSQPPTSPPSTIVVPPGYPTAPPSLFRASADALVQHAVNPSSNTVDPNLIAQRSSIAEHHGLPTLLKQLFVNLAVGTLQPLNSTVSAISEAAMPKAYALWDSLATNSPVSCIRSATNMSFGQHWPLFGQPSTYP